jgi:membrane associated rhomboid family serine protease
MGLYDRDYERDNYGGYGGSYGEPGVRLRMPQSITVRLIVINVIVYLLQLIFAPQFTDIFALHEYWYREPWRIIGFLTSGFLHSEETLWHLLGNMLVLFFFGRAVEERYGSREFLWTYLAGIIFSGICWNVIELLTPNPTVIVDGTAREITGVVLGASGGLATILALFIFNFPNVKIYLYFLFPVPAWILGIFWLLGDMVGALSRSGNVAFTAHLGGALLGFLYYKLNWRLTNLVPRDFKLPSLKRRPSLKVHRGDADSEDSLDAQVDRILKKIKEQGQDSLTAAEKRTLQKGSAAYRKRHQ